MTSISVSIVRDPADRIAYRARNSQQALRHALDMIPGAISWSSGTEDTNFTFPIHPDDESSETSRLANQHHVGNSVHTYLDVLCANDQKR